MHQIKPKYFLLFSARNILSQREKNPVLAYLHFKWILFAVVHWYGNREMRLFTFPFSRMTYDMFLNVKKKFKKSRFFGRENDKKYPSNMSSTIFLFLKWIISICMHKTLLITWLLYFLICLLSYAIFDYHAHFMWF